MTTEQGSEVKDTSASMADGGSSAEAPAPAPAEAQAKTKKRGVGDDFAKTKDDVRSDDDDDEMVGDGTGTFQKADPETLSKRRIVKARRQPATEERSESQAPNAFANISLSEKPAAPAPAPALAPVTSSSPAKSTNLFAKALGGSTGSSFLSGGSSFLTGGAGSGFGQPVGGSTTFADYTSGASTFVSSFTTGKADGAKSGSSGKGREGEEDEDDDEGGERPEDYEAKGNYVVPVVKLKGSDYKPVTGEEGWKPVLQSKEKVKLYKLLPIPAAAALEEGAKPDPSAVVKKDWVEQGHGVIKILEKIQPEDAGSGAPPARVVVRRELGTVSPINVYLKSPSVVAKHAEQAIRLTCMEEPGQLSTYVMKFNKKDDSFAGVLAEMQKRIEEASAGAKA